MRTRYRAARLLPDASTFFAPGSVVVEGDRILWAGPAEGGPAAEEVVDLGDAVLTPGLVNAHSHADLSNLMGAVPYSGSFAEWAEAVGRGRREEGRREAAISLLRDALSRGTTTFGDVVAPESFPDMVAAFAEVGARARLYVEALGFPPSAADAVFERVWELAEMQALPPGLQTGISPHAPYSVSRPLLERLVAVAEGHERPLAVHCAETLEELAFLRHGIGPLRELLKRFSADDPAHVPYGSPGEFLASFAVEKARLALIHGNYLRPRDVPPGAVVVYCPTAHRFFGHPEHPVLEMMEEGVRVALGSDSPASGETLDVLTETRFLARERPDLDAKAVFRMATEWGACALDLEAGRLAPGLLADLAAFTPAVNHEILGRPDARCVFAAVGGKAIHGPQEPE